MVAKRRARFHDAGGVFLPPLGSLLRPFERVDVDQREEGPVDAIDQAIRHDVLELLGIVVHFRPAHAHHLHQKQLDEAKEIFEKAPSLDARVT